MPARGMDLILWRHAEAEDLEETEEGCGADLSRRLTPKGERQALRMAAWLDRQLPEGVRVYCSPAVRTEQTVIALGRKYKARDELRPEVPEVIRTLNRQGVEVSMLTGDNARTATALAQIAGG